VSARPGPIVTLERFGARREPAADGELHVALAPERFADAVLALRADGARLVTLLATAEPQRSIVAIVALRGELVLVRAPADAPVERLSRSWPAACWPELELAELHGVAFNGRASRRALTAPDADHLEREVSGLDVFSIPFGPVRSGVFEAIQFHIESGGEDVLALQTRPFFKRRGMEERFAGLAPEVAVHVAERVAGVASCAYASAFSQAVERALGIQAPARAQRWRAVHCELERIACHLDVIAKEAETAALHVGQARFQILKEAIMGLRARLTGSRFGRGAIVPGGVRGEGGVELGELLAALTEFERRLARDRRLFLGTASMVDRLVNAGSLPRDLIDDYGAVGPLARGSGVSIDARHERPYGAYAQLGPRVVTERAGDAMARILVRFGEIGDSLRMVRASVDRLRTRDGELLAALPAGGAGAACGWVEAPQGELVFWVELAGGRCSRVHIASPSLRNWALFHRAFGRDVLTDFAFIEHSFGLSVAGADR
jgi:formate hydrogenlyase subunit 5